MTYETLDIRRDGGVALVTMTAPPMNLLGPPLVRDLVAFLEQAEPDVDTQVVVFKSGDPDYFIAHVDITRVGEYRDAVTRLVGEPSLGLFLRHLSASRLISIAQIQGRTRGAGNEFALACDMRFAAIENTFFAQPEIGFGLVPGAGGMQHLARLVGRGRALEIILSGEDYDARRAEIYGLVNRAMPASELDAFVTALALRIAQFPEAARTAAKGSVNAATLAPAEAYRADSGLFLARAQDPVAQARTRAALEQHGFQTRDGELALAGLLNKLG